MIRSATADDANAICHIYNHCAQNTIVTFEEQPIPVKEMQRRILDVTKSLPWLVSEDDGRVVGYAYASEWKSRCAYRFSAESTVYLAPDATGRGAGSQLYKELIAELCLRYLHSLIGGIALPDPASVVLHEIFGFKKVAHLEEVGWKFSQWVDVGYWELTLGNVEQGSATDADKLRG